MMKTNVTVDGEFNDRHEESVYDSRQYAAAALDQAQIQAVSSSSNSSPLRRGKWMPEEEAYALAAIRDFNSGYLDAPPATTLRTFLSEKLQCDPMRITKKFTGDASIGKKVFHPATRDDPKILEEIEYSQAKLEHLYQEWRQRLESQEQDSIRKSMAAAAVSVATTSLCDNPNLALFPNSDSVSLCGSGGSMRVPLELANTINNINNIPSAKTKKDIAKISDWLDKSGALLSLEEDNRHQMKKEEIEEEMKQLSQLIDEGGATILAISAELPKLLGKTDASVSQSISLQGSMHKLHSCPDLGILCTKSGIEQPGGQSVSTPIAGKRKRSLSDDYLSPTDSPNNPMKLLASLSSQAVPVPIGRDNDAKQHATTATRPMNVDQDAKAFVNFLQSVKTVNK